MNQSTAYAERVAGRWMGRFRLAWRSEAFPVREKRDGPVLYFDTEAEAECAAWRVKSKIENPVLHRDGERAGRSAAADAVFKPGFFKRRGKTRTTIIEEKSRRRA